MPKYVNYHGKSLSREWFIILTAADDAGVAFTLNSGHRTISQQWSLYRLYKSGRGNLAAFPNPNAPHIRTGRIDHAIDVDALNGGEARLQRWMESKGARVTNPVRGEAWHMEVSAADLRKLAATLDTDKTRPTLRRGKTKNYAPQVRKLQRYLRTLGYKSVSVNGNYDIRTRSAVKRFQKSKGLDTSAVAVVGPKTWAALINAVK